MATPIGNRARINVSPEEFQRAAILTGKSAPVEVFRELIRIAEEREKAVEKQFDNNGNSQNQMTVVNTPRSEEAAGLHAQYLFNENVKTEKQYWEARMAKARTLTAELHLAREIAKMDRTEIELVIEVPKKLPDLTEPVKCYKCKGEGHPSYNCPNVSW